MIGPFSFEGASAVNNHTVGTTPIDDQTIPAIDSRRPKYLAVCHDGSAADLFVEIVFGQDAVAITAGNGFMIPAHEVCTFNVSGFTHYAIVADGGDVEVRVTSLANE